MGDPTPVLRRAALTRISRLLKKRERILEKDVFVRGAWRSRRKGVGAGCDQDIVYTYMTFKKITIEMRDFKI